MKNKMFMMKDEIHTESWLHWKVWQDCSKQIVINNVFSIRAHKCKIDLTAWIKARKVCFDIKEICLAEIWSKSLIKSRSPGNDWYEEVQYTALELAPVVRWPAWISKSFALTDMQLYLYRGSLEWTQDSEIIRQRNEKIAILQKSEKQNGYHYKTANTTKGRIFW